MRLRKNQNQHLYSTPLKTPDNTMNIEICTIGGYNEVGKNMTAIKIDEEVILCDMGIYLPPIVNLQQDDTGEKYVPSTQQLVKIGAIPDDSVIEDWKDKVKAIVLGHAHLDHIGAVQYLAAKYRVPIIGSPYSLQVLKSILEDEDIILPNKLMPTALDKKIKLTENISLELISISHSTLQCSLVALHTKKGVIMYATDFKLDNNPIIGSKPNYKRLRELENQVLLCICECLYAPKEIKTPSESVAREMLKDVLLGVDNEGKAIFVTTFASHLPRIRSVLDFAKRLNRKAVILGRSMHRYIKAAEKLSLIHYSKEAQVIPYRRDVEKKLREIEKRRDKYLVLCTGSQGEPGSILDKIVNKKLHFTFKEEDHIVFYCNTIPAEINIANRAALENQLKKMKVRIFTSIHVSGHSGREDLRDFITMLKPKHLIPCHGEPTMEGAFNELAQEMGYVTGKNVHIMKDGEKLKLTF